MRIFWDMNKSVCSYSDLFLITYFCYFVIIDVNLNLFSKLQAQIWSFNEKILKKKKKKKKKRKKKNHVSCTWCRIQRKIMLPWERGCEGNTFVLPFLFSFCFLVLYLSYGLCCRKVEALDQINSNHRNKEGAEMAPPPQARDQRPQPKLL